MNTFIFYGIGFSIVVMLILLFLPLRPRILYHIVKGSMWAGLAGCILIMIASVVIFCIHPSLLATLSFVCNAVALAACLFIYLYCINKHHY